MDLRAVCAISFCIICTLAQLQFVNITQGIALALLAVYGLVVLRQAIGLRRTDASKPSAGQAAHTGMRSSNVHVMSARQSDSLSIRCISIAQRWLSGTETQVVMRQLDGEILLRASERLSSVEWQPLRESTNNTVKVQSQVVAPYSMSLPSKTSFLMGYAGPCNHRSLACATRQYNSRAVLDFCTAGVQARMRPNDPTPVLDCLVRQPAGCFEYSAAPCP